MKVDVYLNVKQDCVSVRSREPEDYGTVVAHRPKVHVRDAAFVVQSAGVEKARETGTKNVHAFVRGTWDDSVNVVCADAQIQYDPFGIGDFYDVETGRVPSSAELCAVSRGGVSAVGVEYEPEDLSDSDENIEV